MTLDEVLDELYDRVRRQGQGEAEVKEWLVSIGFSPAPLEGEPGYTEAAVGSIARSFGDFYMALVRAGVEKDHAKEIVIAYMNVTFGKS